ILLLFAEGFTTDGAMHTSSIASIETRKDDKLVQNSAILVLKETVIQEKENEENSRKKRP
ncbi:jg19520, partial [Pararge aegeria aegeria]